MQNRLMLPVGKPLLNKQAVIKRIKFRYRNVVKFLFNLVVGLITFSLITQCIAPGVMSASTYKTSWIGNTFGGGSKWVQLTVDSMYVAPNGTVYTNSEWDEAGREVGIYKDGDVIGKANDLHGWGRNGGVAVTANSQYIYVAMRQGPGGKSGEDYPPEGQAWYCVRRYTLSGEPAPFTGGRGWDKSMLLVNESSQITGLANAGNELYVSDPAAGRIRVYSTDTMQQLRSWSVARPRQIAVDGQGDLWIVQAKNGSDAAKILHYSKTGTLLSGEITGVIEPTALAVDNQGRLLVAENGPRQQVLLYNIQNTTAPVGTFGTQGGIYSGTRGAVGSLKFYGIAGLGTDSAGNIYVSSRGFDNDAGGTDLRKFSPAGVMQWRLLGLEFLDNADADPSTNGADVFTKHEHFVMDYSKGSGQEWTYKGYTLDKFRYPDDPRLHLPHASAFVRRIRGRRFLYLTDMYASYLSVFRFDGEIAVPCALFAKGHMDEWPTNQPAAGKWIWLDRNGDGSIQSNEYESFSGEDWFGWGWEIDSQGDVWQVGEGDSVIRRYRLQGLDAYGSPIYTGAASDTTEAPALFDDNGLGRIKYFPATDVMFVSGYTRERPKTGGEWGIVGREIVRYDNWSTTRNVRWRIVLPYKPDGDFDTVLTIKAMDVVGTRVFAVDSRTAQVYVYDSLTGAFVTKLSPGPEVGGKTGWVDIPYAVRAYRRSNGEYLVFVEEDQQAKVIMYRLK